jgi:hypothetical protein
MGGDLDSTGERPERVRGDGCRQPPNAWSARDDVCSHLYRFSRKVVRDLAWAMSSPHVVGDPDTERTPSTETRTSEGGEKTSDAERRRARRGDPLPTRACSRTKTRSACWKIRRRGWTLSTRTLHMCWIGSKANAEATSSAFTSARSWSTACVSILQSERKRSPCTGRLRNRWAPAEWSDSSSSCSGQEASAGRRKSRTGSIT